MSNELLPDGRVIDPDYGYPHRKNSSFDACASCIYSKMTCENRYNREVRVPLEPGDDPSLEIVTLTRGRNREGIKRGTGYKMVDGVEYGIYTSEDQIPGADRCGWYIPQGYEHIFNPPQEEDK